MDGRGFTLKSAIRGFFVSAGTCLLLFLCAGLIAIFKGKYIDWFTLMVIFLFFGVYCCLGAMRFYSMYRRGHEAILAGMMVRRYLTKHAMERISDVIRELAQGRPSLGYLRWLQQPETQEILRQCSNGAGYTSIVKPNGETDKMALLYLDQRYHKTAIRIQWRGQFSNNYYGNFASLPGMRVITLGLKTAGRRLNRIYLTLRKRPLEIPHDPDQETQDWHVL